MKVRKNGRELITTQIFVRGAAGNKSDGVFSSAGDLLDQELVQADFKKMKDSKIGELAAKHGDMLSQPRAAGTFAALDVRDTSTRDRLIDAARQRGLECGGSGERSVRFRPALVLSSRHVAECLDILDAAAKAVR